MSTPEGQYGESEPVRKPRLRTLVRTAGVAKGLAGVGSIGYAEHLTHHAEANTRFDDGAAAGFLLLFGALTLISGITQTITGKPDRL